MPSIVCTYTFDINLNRSSLPMDRLNLMILFTFNIHSINNRSKPVLNHHSVVAFIKVVQLPPLVIYPRVARVNIQRIGSIETGVARYIPKLKLLIQPIHHGMIHVDSSIPATIQERLFHGLIVMILGGSQVQNVLRNASFVRIVVIVEYSWIL